MIVLLETFIDLCYNNNDWSGYMYPILHIGDLEIVLYRAIGFIGSYVVMFYNDLRIKSKKRPIGYRTMIVHVKLSHNQGFISRYLYKMLPVLESESFTMSYIIYAFANWILGDLVGTGANYFGSLFVIPIIWVILSVYYGSNPLEQLDFISTCLPLYLIFAKLACFAAGCCGGLYWEDGLYNTKYDENQIPVQLIETFWGLLIFIILIQYRKKAKTGTIFPMYTILYCATRFLSEFLRREDNILWILKKYHILCLIGIVYGIILWIIIAKYRDKINEYYDTKYSEAENTLVKLRNKLTNENKNKMHKKKKKPIGRKL